MREAGSTGRLGASAGSAPCPLRSPFSHPLHPLLSPSPSPPSAFPFPCSAGFSKFPNGPMSDRGFSQQPITGGAGPPPVPHGALRRSASALPPAGSGTAARRSSCRAGCTATSPAGSGRGALVTSTRLPPRQSPPRKSRSVKSRRN